MKKFLLFIGLLLPLGLMAQTDSLASVTPKEQFIVVTYTSSTLSISKGRVKIDFGSNAQLLKQFDKKIMDDTRKVTACKSVADAFNYITALGWEFVFAHATDLNNDYPYHKYIFKRKVN